MTSKLYDEQYRPQFHFTARENWLNDPNGLVYYKGEYHLFFQHNPYGTAWGNMTWGHAISGDLVHWEQLPNALEPDALGTMFSGSAVVDVTNTAGFQHGDEKAIVAIYTAAGGTSQQSQSQPFTQCIAYSNDRCRTFTKYDRNPVLANIVNENRDPQVVWHAPTHQWVMALYMEASTYALFASPDLKTWTHLQDVEVPGSSECPDFFEIPVDGNPADTRWVLTGANGRYLVGHFDGQQFVPEIGPLQPDFGANYYAVQTYSDTPDGRRIQIAWMNGGKYPNMPFNQQMSFPCVLTLRRLPEGLRLCREPVREIEILRGQEHVWTNHLVQPDDDLLAGLTGDLFEIRADLELSEGAEFKIVVRGEPISYSAATQQITCLGKTAELATIDGRLSLQVLVDRASIEVFGNDGIVSLTSCWLPEPGAQGLAVDATSGTKLNLLVVHELRSAWR